MSVRQLTLFPLLFALGSAVTSVMAAPSAPAGALGTTGTPFPLSVDFTYRGAQLGGRSLGVSERSLRANVSSQVSLWYGAEDVLAEGRSGQTRFETSAKRWGVRAALRGDLQARENYAVSYEVAQSGQGRATQTNDFVTYAPPRTQTLALSYEHRGGRVVGRLSVEGSQVRAGTESGRVFGVAAGADFPLGGAFRGSLGATALSEHGAAGDSVRPILDAGVAWSPLRWARLEMGMYVAPHGLAIAGTPMTALSSFLVYRPGGAAQQLAGRATGFGTLRLVIAQSF